MNQETLIVCKHEIAKLMRNYESLKPGTKSLNEVVAQNVRAIYLIAEILQATLKDKE